MNGSGEPDTASSDTRLEVSMYGPGDVNQAGRDLHIHHGNGVRRVLAPSNGVDSVCPYPGLAAFTGEYAGWFFGRDRLTSDLLRRLDAAASGGGPVMVVAASGAGKSSLLQAGLLHQVTNGALPAAGSRDWPQVMITPGAHPMREAATVLAAALPAAVALRPPSYPDDPGADDLDDLLLNLAQAAVLPGRSAPRILLVIDPFEELFTLCESETEREEFISWLWRAAGSARRGGPLAIVACGLRADFYARCVTGHAELRRSLQTSQVLVGPMSDDELRQAILNPARAAGIEVEPGLADLLLSDLRASRDERADSDRATAADYDAGRLPLLAHALRATWQGRHGSVLTVEGYRATGGIDHAIAETADRVYNGLDSAQQREAKLMFLRLVKIGDSPSGDARRPVSSSDLVSNAAAAAVLDAYISNRLLTSTSNAVQITHEALLSAWPELKGWLEEDRTGNLSRQRIEDIAAEWSRDRQDTSLLHRGASLEASASWASTHSRDLTQTARDFLIASRRLARRATMIRRGALAILIALTLIATAAAGVAHWQRGIADKQRNRAIFNQVVAEAGQLQSTNPSLAAQLNLTAWHMDPTPALTAQLLSTSTVALANPVPGPGGAVFTVAFSPDGRTMAAGGYGGTGQVGLWNVTTPAHPTRVGQPFAGPTNGVGSVAFSPDGRILAAGGSGKGTVRLWDVTTLAHPTLIGRPLDVGQIYTVAFSPDGHVLAAGSADGTVWLWDITNPVHPALIGHPRVDPAGVWPVAFSPDGHVLAVGGADGKVWLWNITMPAGPAQIGVPLTGPVGPVQSVAFSPDGRTLAAGGEDSKVWLWNVTTPAHPVLIGQPLTGPASMVYSVAFSPDGRTLAAGSQDSKVWLWNVTTPAHPVLIGQPLTGPAGGLYSVAFSPDGRTLAAGSIDGLVWSWNLPSTLVNGPGGGVESVAFSPDGRVLAAASDDGKVRLWKVASPGRPVRLGGPLAGPGGQLYSVAFSPDGRILAASGNGKVRLWKVASTGRPVRLGRPLTISGGLIPSVMFSPNGRILAAASQSGTVWLWNLTRPAHPVRLGRPLTVPGGFVISVAFSPDGRILAAGGLGQRVLLWNVTTPAHPAPIGKPLTGPGGPVQSVAFSPDGRTLAAASDDDTVWLWNITIPSHAARIGQLTGPVTEVQSVAFSPDRHTLAASSLDGRVWLWSVATPTHPTRVGQPLTGPSAELSLMAFSPDGRTLAVGANDNMVWLWKLDLSQVINRICATTNGNLSPAQWGRYVSQLPYDPPCRRS